MNDDRVEEIKSAEQDMEAAYKMLAKALPGKPAFKIEKRYCEAYEKLVQLGVRNKLRLKYRRGMIA